MAHQLWAKQSKKNLIEFMNEIKCRENLIKRILRKYYKPDTAQTRSMDDQDEQAHLKYGKQKQ